MNDLPIPRVRIGSIRGRLMAVERLSPNNRGGLWKVQCVKCGWTGTRRAGDLKRAEKRKINDCPECFPVKRKEV